MPNTNDPDTQSRITSLDSFLQIPQQPAPVMSSPGTGSKVLKTLPMPEADKIVVVGIFVDDSGSMDPYPAAVREGFNNSVEGFRGAKGSDFHLDVRGFKMTYFSGLLKDVTPDSLAGYRPDFGSTPLVTNSRSHLIELHSLGQQYRASGIPTIVSQLIITDALPISDGHAPGEFKSLIEPGDYIVGIGIAAIGDENAVGNYSRFFSQMGITKILTPSADPSDVRHAINQFSRSVASIA